MAGSKRGGFEFRSAGALNQDPKYLNSGGALGELEAERDRLEKKERPENTIKAYEKDFEQFEKWCKQIQRAPVPATDLMIELYICYMNKQGRKPSTISRALTSIAVKHSEAGFDTPIGPNSKKRMRSVRRDRGSQKRKAAPITVEHLKNILTVCPLDILGIRDRAMILTGWTAALRRSEIAALNLEDLEERPDGIVLTIKRSKTDQLGVTYKIGLPIVENWRLCPVRALRKWLDLAAIKDGAVFRAIGKRGRNVFFSSCGDRISDKTVSQIIKRRVKAAGYDSAKYSGHSLRSGLATSAAAAGISEHLIMKITGHTSEKTVREYIQDGAVFLNHPAIALLTA